MAGILDHQALLTQLIGFEGLHGLGLAAGDGLEVLLGQTLHLGELHVADHGDGHVLADVVVTGGVAAFDPEQDGVVSAGGVGFDISCGVRTLHTGLDRVQLDSHLAVLADRHAVPFYVAAPASTFDPETAGGDEIVIEERGRL